VVLPSGKEKGVRHLPDITHKAAVTFLDVVVFNGKITGRDLFHGLVHAAQVNALGVTEFTELFVRGFLRSRSYFLVPLRPTHSVWTRNSRRIREHRFQWKTKSAPGGGLPVLKPKKELLDKSGIARIRVSTAFLPKSIQE